MATTDAETPPSFPASEVKGGLTPYLTVGGAVKAAEFYVEAFKAEIATIYPPDDKGRTMHAHLYVNGSSLMLSDPFPEHGCALEQAQGFNLTLHVDDVDVWWSRALAAGASPLMPPTEMFWGARYAQLRDPFGVVWALNQPLK